MLELHVEADMHAELATEDRAATLCRFGHSLRDMMDDMIAVILVPAGIAIRRRIDYGTAKADRAVAGNAATGTVGRAQRRRHQTASLTLRSNP